MIVVTGSPRSGTSLVMQTLDILGLPIVGEKFHADFPITEGNPKGYYDLPFAEQVEAAETGGFGDKYAGKVVKLFGESLSLVDKTVLTHIIVCKRRDSRAQDRSCLKLLKKELEITNESELREQAKERLKYMTLDTVGERRRIYHGAIDWYLELFTGYQHTVWFEDMKYSPKESIKELQEFFDVESKSTLKKAINNVGV